jgi:hypothetical protein
MTAYTAFDSQDSSNYQSGLTIQKALDERWDIDGSRKASKWLVMTDADFIIHQTGAEYTAETGADGVTRIKA